MTRFGRPVAALVAVLWLALGASPVSAQQQVAPPTTIDGQQVSVLVRSMIVALDQANRTGNYTVLRDLGSFSFRTSLTAAMLGDLFRVFRDSKADLGGAVLYDAQIEKQPILTTDGQLMVEGVVPTRPREITFSMRFISENGIWGIDALNVGMRDVAPGAQTPGTPAAPAPTGPPPRVETDPGFIPYPLPRPAGR